MAPFASPTSIAARRSAIRMHNTYRNKIREHGQLLVVSVSKELPRVAGVCGLDGMDPKEVGNVTQLLNCPALWLVIGGHVGEGVLGKCREELVLEVGLSGRE